MTAIAAKPFNLVVGVDFEADGQRALNEAIRLAGIMHNAEIHAVYIASPSQANSAADVPHPPGSPAPTEAEVALSKLERLCRERLAAAQAGAGEVSFHRIVTHVGVGDPAATLIQLIADLDADLAIVGTHDRRGLERLVLGSVAERVMRRSSCPVMVVRAKDHQGLGEVPEIEPPCPDCVAVQLRHHNPTLWCARHELAKYHPATHRYSYVYSGSNAAIGKPMSGPAAPNG